MGKWQDDSWKWDLKWRRNLFSWEEQQEAALKSEIQDTKIERGISDVRDWIHSKEGIYTTKSAYQALTRDHRRVQQRPALSKVWQEYIPSKISVFAWQVLQDKIPTKLNLLKRGIIQDIADCKCILCGLVSEDSNHLFIHCKIAWGLWNSCYRWWGSKQVLDRDCGRVFEQHPFIFNIKEVRRGWECIWFSVIWSIWLARNEKLFRGKEVESGRLLELVQVRSFKWIKGKRRGSLFTVSDWILNPVSCLNPSQFPFSMKTTNKGNKLDYGKILEPFTAIDLSCNKFEAEIPEEVGNLEGLQLLNFSNNILDGQIPLVLEYLANLEALDLSQNKHTRRIPTELMQLKFLKVFNVSHNHLMGPIPKGQQFDTFENNSFDGNLGQCGMPLSRKCDYYNFEVLPPPYSTSEGNEDPGLSGEFGWKLVLMGYGYRFLIGVDKLNLYTY
ncbi:hypothetical protein SLEP1_g35450 [Rubroshorea leprosula]|uniref:Reverse transcriptase zinc-binding domain-containing protein n=1 Tax=Rubroshorea leprosula TaxID=152421 RepID=A0AAV5KN66_9ROSI|nr:hypothetical protein SLEP1_g35450 [Rubroshorea leprosula]